MDLLFMDVINSNRVDRRNSKIQRDMGKKFFRKIGIVCNSPY